MIIGLHAAKGAAVAVALTGDHETPQAVRRDSFPLVPDRRFELGQPYHAAKDRPLAEGEAIVRRAIESAERHAADGLTALLDELDDTDEPVDALALADRPETALEPVADILRSHVGMHAAEGEVLRAALRWAAGNTDRPVVPVMEREVTGLVAVRLGTSEDDVTARVAALGKPLGSPWRQEHKLAALVAWYALTARID